MSKEQKLRMRNSTAEFLIFTRQAGEDGIEVRVTEETVWLTQKLMAALFEVTVPMVSEHLANLYSQGEIVKGSTIRNFRTVQKEGGREVARTVDFYNLDAIIERLKKEVRVLREERDILKKAAAYFAKDSQNGARA